MYMYEALGCLTQAFPVGVRHTQLRNAPAELYDEIYRSVYQFLLAPREDMFLQSIELVLF